LKTTGRRRFYALVTAVAVLAVVGAVYLKVAALATGPLQNTHNVNAFGNVVDAGRPFSVVVFYRSEVAATATLLGISLADPEPGLELMGALVARGDVTTTFLDSFPPSPEQLPVGAEPLENKVVAVSADDRASEIDFVVGLRVNAPGIAPAAHGFWLDYEVNGSKYRALLAWLVRACSRPMQGPCPAPDPEAFEFP
jgi:hypothetical protein